MIFGMMHLVPPKLDIFSAWFGLTERGPTANGWAANSAHLVAARPAHLDRGRRSDPTEDGVRASLKRLNGGEGETLAHFSSPRLARGPSRGSAGASMAGGGRVLTRHLEERAAHCDNPPRKIPYYRLRPIHFGH
jgi:hypothetical protein